MVAALARRGRRGSSSRSPGPPGPPDGRRVDAEAASEAQAAHASLGVHRLAQGGAPGDALLLVVVRVVAEGDVDLHHARVGLDPQPLDLGVPQLRRVVGGAVGVLQHVERLVGGQRRLEQDVERGDDGVVVFVVVDKGRGRSGIHCESGPSAAGFALELNCGREDAMDGAPGRIS